MPHPLDAERAADPAPAEARVRPTPVPRASTEALATDTVEPDEPNVAAPPDPDGVDVWALVHRAQRQSKNRPARPKPSCRPRCRPWW